MAGPKLQAYVCVDGPNGMRQFGPDDEVPDWALSLITNPDAWEDGLPGLPEDPVDHHDGAEDGESVPGSQDGETVRGDTAPAAEPETENQAPGTEPSTPADTEAAPAAVRRRTRAPKKADDVAGDAS